MVEVSGIAEKIRKFYEKYIGVENAKVDGWCNAIGPRSQ